jgi:MFS transporter, PAT family, beta-lactamase induction signal transducer AmpG
VVTVWPIANVGETKLGRGWQFGVASIPYGAFNGFIAVGLPYLLRRHGLSVQRIASISSIVQTPAIWFFLWAPIVDLKFRRRTWIVVLSAGTALCAGLAIGGAASTLPGFTALLLAASVLNQPISSAVGGLIAATVPNERRGITGGWSQTGILTGGVAAGGAVVWLVGVGSPTMTAVVLAFIIAVPASIALWLREPKPNASRLGEQMAFIGKDLARTLERKDVWIGLAFFLSPIGASALIDLFTAVAPDFRASNNAVLIVVGVAGVLTPLGAIAGGVASDRFNRWRTYAAAGLLSALAASAILVARPTEWTYIWGAAGYAFAAGFAYAAFMALALELVGSNAAGSGTRFTLFMAAVNVPVVYMVRLDGFGHAHAGLRGMLGADATANAIFGGLLLAIVPIIRRGASRTRDIGRRVGTA